MRRPGLSAFLTVPLAGLAFLASSCGTNPMTYGLPGSACGGCLGKPAEDPNAPGTFFAPQGPADNRTYNFTLSPPAPTGYAALDIGSEWAFGSGSAGAGQSVYEPTQALQLPANILVSNNATESTYGASGVWLRNYDAFSSNPNDYYVRLEGTYIGFGLPNGSLNYMELPIFFNGNSGPGVDVSSYHGFSFWTRGTGNFSVCLLSGSQDGSPPAPGPYIQLNFYQYLFNNQLVGDNKWRQVTVTFQNMTQIYGLATPLNSVLQKLYGLQFMQMGSPGPAVVTNFWLDVDDIRFF